MTAAPPAHGELWHYIPTTAGREKPSSLGGDRVLVVQRTSINSILPTALCVPVESTPRMPGLAVELSDDDPLPGLSAVCYRMTPLYIPWFAERIGVVREATMRQVVGALAKLITD